MEQIPSSPVPHHHRHFRLGLLISVTVVVLSVISWILWPTKEPQQPVTNNTQIVANIIAAPREFTDFVGQIASIDTTKQHLTATYGLTGDDGTLQTKTYDIAVTTATTLKTQTITSAGDTLSSLAFKDLKIGQRIHLFAQSNLYPITTFTPTSLYLIKESSL